MTPIERLSFIKALIYGAEQALPEAQADAIAYRKLVRAKAFETDISAVTYKLGKQSIAYDPDKLLEWAQSNMRHQVMQEHTTVVPAQVHPGIYKTLESRLKIVGDNVVDTQTGEMVTFASVRPAGADTAVTTLTPEAKAQAAAYIAEQLEQITAAMRPEVTA